VTTPDDRARDRDRDAAIEQVEAALKSGRIVQADHDMRIEQLKHAQTATEVRMLVQDLAPAPPVPYGPPSPGASPSYPTLADVRAMTADGTKVSKKVFVLPLIAVVIFVVGLIGGIVALTNALGDGGGGIGGIGGGDAAPADVLSEQGYADLLDAIEAETGGTVAFSAVLYPTYAVVELPVDATTNREGYWYWDGHELSDNDTKSTSSFARMDLSTVDPAVIVDLVERVQRNVEDPTSYYAIVRAPDDDRAVVWAYASNEYSETAYLGARRDGTVTYDSTEH
jgi:hypothetical protein